jgi:hypothetical protein
MAEEQRFVTPTTTALVVVKAKQPSPCELGCPLIVVSAVD